jgi:hypothetical protein
MYYGSSFFQTLRHFFSEKEVASAFTHQLGAYFARY